MKFSYIVFGSTIVSFFCLAQNVYAAAIDPVAAVVKVRTSCKDNTIPIDNCFESTTALTNWMAITRKPNASKPLQVDIGPGTFGETVIITCNPSANYTGYTSFKGAGNGQTTVSAPMLVPIKTLDSPFTQLQYPHAQN